MPAVHCSVGRIVSGMSGGILGMIDGFKTTLCIPRVYDASLVNNTVFSPVQTIPESMPDFAATRRPLLAGGPKVEFRSMSFLGKTSIRSNHFPKTPSRYPAHALHPTVLHVSPKHSRSHTPPSPAENPPSVPHSLHTSPTRITSKALHPATLRMPPPL